MKYPIYVANRGRCVTRNSRRSDIMAFVFSVPTDQKAVV
jgi:hypothetical protein